VRQVGGDAGGAAEIVQGELGDEGVHLQKQGQRLADAARGAQDRDLWEGFAWERGRTRGGERFDDFDRFLEKAKSRRLPPIAFRGSPTIPI
jgi:hypothetical protein